MTDVLLILLIALLILFIVMLAIQARRLPTGPQASPGASTILIPPERAQEGAAKGLADYGLTTRADWQPYLAPPLAPQQPIPVQRLDQGDPAEMYYYLVPYGDLRSPSAIALVDGLTGEYLEATPMSRSGRPWYPQPLDAGTTLASARPGGSREHPFWVWRPCVESVSPYYPFRLVIEGGGPLRYIRIDGETFDRLTDLQPGGGAGDCSVPPDPAGSGATR